MVSSLKKKFEIMGSLIQKHSISGFLAKEIAGWQTKGLIKQIDFLSVPFNQPSGKSYVGKKHGENGTDYVLTWWYSTYDRCREITISEDILSVIIYEGSFLDGARTGPSRRWNFKLNFDWTKNEDLARILNWEWDAFIERKFEEEEHERIVAAKIAIENRLLGLETPGD